MLKTRVVMKSSTFILASATAALALLFSASCSKDTFREPPEIVNGCPITSFGITFWEGSYTRSFQYNKAPHLLGMTTGTHVPNSQLDHQFRYEAFGRVSDYIITGAGFTGAFIWHRYSYPDAKTIIDSSYDSCGRYHRTAAHHVIRYFCRFPSPRQRRPGYCR